MATGIARFSVLLSMLWLIILNVFQVLVAIIIFYYFFCVDKCKLCEPGSYSNVSRATSCDCCPAGFESTYMRTTCIPCSRHEYFTDACEMCKTCDGSNTCKSWENSFFKNSPEKSSFEDLTEKEHSYLIMSKCALEYQTLLKNTTPSFLPSLPLP